MAVALAAVGWGTWALFLRGSGLPPAWQSVLILTVIAVAWAGPALWPGSRPHRARRTARAWLLLAFLGVLDAGNYLFYFAAVDRGPLAIAVLTHYLAPVLVAAGAPAILKEPLGRRTVPSLCAALVGLGLLVGSSGTSGLALTTALYGGASALFYGASTLASKRILRDFSPAEALAWHCAVSALCLLPLASAMPPLRAFLGYPLLGAALVGALGGALFYYGLGLITAQRAAVLTYLEPLVASLVGALAFGEQLSPLGLAGGALILASGVAVIADTR